MRQILRISATLLLSFGLLTACSAQSDRDRQAKSSETQAKIAALLEKTLKQMKPLKGGHFWLGDFGELMAGEGEGKFEEFPPLGPNPKLQKKYLPFTPEDNNKPPRWVSLDGFYMQSHKVTYEDFDVFVAANALPPHPPEGDENWNLIWQDARKPGNVPAGVKWQQAKDYCLWLANLSGLPVDLPTEAQWEYAASNGVNSSRRPYPTPSGKLIENKTHPSFTTEREMIGRLGSLYPVGRFEPSPAGLYDLVGNGFDWVNDWYAPGYAAGPEHNPTGPASGSEKVLRGMSPADGWTMGYRHLDRHHKTLELQKLKSSGRLAPFSEESFRCAINHSGPLSPNR